MIKLWKNLYRLIGTIKDLLQIKANQDHNNN